MRKPTDLVLLTDDCDTMPTSVHYSLYDERFQVEQALTYKDAQALLRTKFYCLLLLDCQLSGMGGIEPADELRRLYPHIPQIMITAYRSDSLLKQCLERGMILIEKPFLDESLKRAVYLVLDELPARNTENKVPVEVIQRFAAEQSNRRWKPQDHPHLSARIYADFFAKIAGYTEQWISDKEEAKDIACHAHLKLWEKNPEFNNGWGYYRYWKTIVENLCRDEYRQKEQKGEWIVYPGELPETETETLSPLEAVMDAREYSALEQQILSLPYHYRQVIELRTEGRSYRQLSE